MAALLPRTNSELLQVDTMTVDKVKRFGPRIMDVLSDFWKVIDEKEHMDIVRQLDILKNQSITTTTSSTSFSNNPKNQSNFYTIYLI